MTTSLLVGDCRSVLPTLPAGSVHCVVTSPPYFGLRDYGVAGQIGLEATPDEYVAALVGVFRDVRRVLRKDGTLWCNLGDSYNSAPVGRFNGGGFTDTSAQTGGRDLSGVETSGKLNKLLASGLPPKNLLGIPWSVAKALQAPYYTGAIKSESDRVWLAATVDAEGSICGFTHQRKDNGEIRRGIHITITNSNTRMLDEAYRIWPTSKRDHNMHGVGHLGRLDTFRWISHGVEDKAQLLAELYPYLICKKNQALLAWNFLQISKQARGRNKGEEGNKNRDRCGWIVHALSKLNHLEHVDLPDWLETPPSQYEPGYYLRQDLIWSKSNPMPESVRDRCTKSHEYLFLLSKSERYYYDAEAIAETASSAGQYRPFNDPKKAFRVVNGKEGTGNERPGAPPVLIGETRNKRSVWEIATQPYADAHFATFPPALIEPCIKAGPCTVLDPFGGAGTTGLVADRLQRNAVLIELNHTYAGLAESRIKGDAPLFVDINPLTTEVPA
jgi:DNA modification methylase